MYHCENKENLESLLSFFQISVLTDRPILENKIILWIEQDTTVGGPGRIA